MLKGSREFGGGVPPEEVRSGPAGAQNEVPRVWLFERRGFGVSRI